MVKIFHLMLLLFWMAVANSFFFDFANVTSETMVSAGVHRYKFLWFIVELVWCLFGYKLYQRIKYIYWNNGKFN